MMRLVPTVSNVVPGFIVALCFGCGTQPEWDVAQQPTESNALKSRPASAKVTQRQNVDWQMITESAIASDEKDKTDLQGTWRLVKVEASSERSGIPRFPTCTELTFDCSLWYLKRGEAIESGLFEFDSTTAPKQITFFTFGDISPAVKFLGIYKLAGDKLVFCWIQRPTDFDASGPTHRVVTEWQRAND